MIRDVLDGLLALWRRGCRWLVWTPWRLAGAITVMMLAVIVLSAVVRGGNVPQPSSTPLNAADLPTGWSTWPVVTARAVNGAPGGVVASPVIQNSPPIASRPTEPTAAPAHREPSQATEREVLAIVRQFAQQYTDTRRSHQAWERALAPLVTAQLRQGLPTVGLESVAAIGSTGAPEVVALSDMGGLVNVPTQTGVMAVRVTNLGTSWVISQISPPARDQ
jgi:hypothetical protein